jgi:sugar/nucleoside kinase (ribokinase family)
MSRSLTRLTGIEQEHRQACAPGHRSIAFVELITTGALALSTAIAVTAVSIGIARAEVVGTVATGDSASFAIALLIGLLLSATGALTAIMAVGPRSD